MKSNQNFRNPQQHQDSDDLKKGTKLPPIKKSGKDRHNLYSELNDDEDDELSYDSKKRESILDYYDDEEEDN